MRGSIPFLLWSSGASSHDALHRADCAVTVESLSTRGGCVESPARVAERVGRREKNARAATAFVVANTHRHRGVAAGASLAIGVLVAAAALGCNGIFGIEQLHSSSSDASVPADGAVGNGSPGDSSTGAGGFRGINGAAHPSDGGIGDDAAAVPSFGDASADGTLVGGGGAPGAGGGAPEAGGGAPGAGSSAPEAGGGADRNDVGSGTGGALLLADSGTLTSSESGASIDSSADQPDSAVDAGAITVVGKIVDSWRFPVKNVRVAIGGSEIGTTDENGRFEAHGVVPPYDVTFYVRSIPAFVVFQDLMRPDPTLQVPLAGTHYVQYISATVTGEPFSTNDVGRAVVASSSGLYAPIADIQEGNSFQPLLKWAGPTDSESAVLHLLRTVMSSTTRDVDQYSGYASAPVTLGAAGPDPSVTLDLAGAGAGAIASGSLQVTVGQADHICVYVHFDANAVVQVIDDSTPSATTRAYHVPNRPGWTYSVLAESSSDDGPTLIAHKAGLSGAWNDISLPFPEPAVPVDPPNNAIVTPSTAFRWTAPLGYAVNLLTMDFHDFLIYVVTTRRSVLLPSFKAFDNYELPGAQPGSWYVQVQGSYTSTDDAAGPQGYNDPYNAQPSRRGPDGDGSHSYSAARSMRTPL